MVIANPMAMCLFWGKDFIQLFNEPFGGIWDRDFVPLFGRSATGNSTLGLPDYIPILKSVLSGEAFQFSETIPTKDLKSRFYDFTFSPVQDTEGRFSGILLTVVETTEKKLIEERLADSKDQYHFAIEAADLGTWVYNPATGKFSANPILKDWFGLGSEESIELGYALDSIMPEDRPRVDQAIKNALDYNSGGKFDIEYKVKNPISGEIRLIHSQGKSSFKSDNSCVRGH